MHKMIIPNQCFVDFLDTHKYTQFDSKVPLSGKSVFSV